MKNRFTDITILSAAHMSVARTIKINSIPHHAIIIRLNKKSIYRINGKETESFLGDAVIIPKGSNYEVIPCDGTNDYLAIRFSGCECEWEMLHVDDIDEARALHAEICRALVFDDDKSRLRSISLFYKLLSTLSPERSTEPYVSKRQLALILPALSCIEKNIFSSEFKISSLSKVFGISDVYFRRIFKKHTGKNPQAYVTSKRLDRAEFLLKSGSYKRIGEVAEAVGYDDPLYFSRLYKKHFGHPPSLEKSEVE